MLTEFLSYIRDNQLLKPDSATLLAVSGGVDSVAMCDLFHKAGFPFAIAHANFLLRGGESSRDEAFVKELAEKYKVRYFGKHFETAIYARSHKLSVQVAARNLRYRWFDELLVRHGFEFVATAHHLDDQVETFLINLARGTGIAGLHGIPVKQGRIIRPMMFATRKEIEQYARENELGYVEDSSNLSLKYTRNRIRHNVIPQLEKINPSFRENIRETIRNIREAEMIFKKAVADAEKSVSEQDECSVRINIERFFSLDPISTYAFKILSPFGFNLAQVKDIIGMKDSLPGKEVLSDTHRLVRDRDCFIVVPKNDIRELAEFEIDWKDLATGIKTPVELSFEIQDKLPARLKYPPAIALLDLDKLEFPLKLRKWKRGDRFIPFGMSGWKKLSDFFTDEKYSKINKENQWLLCSGSNIAWVIGCRTDDRFKVTTQSLKILKILVNQSHPH